MKSVDLVLWTTSSTPHLSDEKTPRPFTCFKEAPQLARNPHYTNYRT